MLDVGKVSALKARWTPIVFAGLLPLFVIPAWVSIAQGKMILLAFTVFVGAITWAFSRAIAAEVAIPKSLLLLAGTFLPIAYAISAVWHRDLSSWVSTNGEQDTVVVISLLFALFALTALTASSAFRTLVALFRALFIGSGALIIFQLLRLIAPDALSLGVLAGEASSILGSWHDLGIMLGLLVLLSASLIFTPVAESSWKWLVGGVGALSFLSLLVVNWEDVWYMLAALIFLACVYYLDTAYIRGASFRENVRENTLWLALSAFVLLGALASPFIYSYMPQRLQIAQVEVRPSWRGTFEVGEKVFGGGPALVFGSGPNTFSDVWGEFKPASVNSTSFWGVDFNAGVGRIPTSLIALGLLGLFAWGALLFALLFSVIGFVRSQESASPMRTYLFAGLAGATYLLAFQVFYTPGIVISALAFLFLGIIVIAQSAEATRLHISLFLREWRGMANFSALLLISVFFVYASTSALRASISDVLVDRSAASYSSTQDISASLRLVRAALVAYPDNDRAERAAVELGLLQLREVSEKGRVSDEARITLQEALSQTIRHGLSAITIDSGNYQNWLALATLYQNLAGAGVEGAYESAKAAYESASTANPTNPLPLVQFAQLEAAEGKGDAALQLLDRALALKEDLPTALYLRSQIMAERENFPAAQSDAHLAAQLVPQDPLGWYNLGAIFYVSGSYESAIDALSQALALQGNYSNALYMLALSYDKLGKHEEAGEILQRLSALNPDNESVRDLQAQFDAGEPLEITPR